MKITLSGIEFGYDRAGRGEGVVLVMGLGAPRLGWFPQFGPLSERFDVTIFDNRGSGETAAPGPFTIADMASDVVAVADAVGYERFHLVGISMGGMIAQEVALSHPDRLRSLTLMSTTPGGAEAVAMTPEFVAALSLPDPAERMRRMTELSFGERFRREHPEMMELVLGALESGATGAGFSVQPDEGFVLQVTAIVSWMAGGGAAGRLGQIAVPTLVLHGGDDLLLPLANAEILARDIPGARLRVWPDAGHALNLERAAEVNEELVAHFESVGIESGRRA